MLLIRNYPANIFHESLSPFTQNHKVILKTGLKIRIIEHQNKKRKNKNTTPGSTNFSLITKKTHTAILTSVRC